ncbi:dihydrofolate reductase family protein [Lacinutrix sp. Bg11-31]|uniref:dihydrofolate reductase family protein n=1 Tax=Lacinutrix sp. Bg11-31 TaxID=2057808 RepID=UPI0018E1E683|nr:dihydrofolate reductase family protein [Lacinutrix sp. Bg11-31]
MSNKLKEIPESHKEKAFYHLCIDGRTTIRDFLKEDFIDEMVLTTIPILLGGGSSLFTELPNELNFELIGTKNYLNQITQNHYKRKK